MATTSMVFCLNSQYYNIKKTAKSIGYDKKMTNHIKPQIFKVAKIYGFTAVVILIFDQQYCDFHILCLAKLCYLDIKIVSLLMALLNVIYLFQLPKQ